MAGTFQFLDDVSVSDAAFDVRADSPSELCQAAAQAVIETLADPATVGISWRRTVEHQDETLSGLLFAWLSDIVYWKDVDGVVFHETSVTVTEEPGARWRLAGSLAGEPVAPGRQDLRGDVKAITKHLYDVRQTDGGQWTARIVIDL